MARWKKIYTCSFIVVFTSISIATLMASSSRPPSSRPSPAQHHINNPPRGFTQNTPEKPQSEPKDQGNAGSMSTNEPLGPPFVDRVAAPPPNDPSIYQPRN